MITPSVQSVLESFEQLTDAEKHQFVIEVIRRAPDTDDSPLTGEDLAQVADELFVEMDNRETQP